jgi:hypothetical protein
MVGTEPSPLGCPYCSSTRFSRFAPPYGAQSVIRCAACLTNMTLSDLKPHRSTEEPIKENRYENVRR